MMELIVALALGLIVVGSATQLFKVGVDSSAVISQRAEMQQNTRIAMNLITKDVSMAGAGLPTGGIQLPRLRQRVLSAELQLSERQSHVRHSSRRCERKAKQQYSSYWSRR
jgi:type II secretory pathway component PulJ